MIIMIDMFGRTFSMIEGRGLHWRPWIDVGVELLFGHGQKLITLRIVRIPLEIV